MRASEPLPLGPLPGGRYPDPHVESLAKPKGAFGASGFPAFAGTMAVERIATGFRWAEGPVYFPAGRYVLFMGLPDSRSIRQGAGESISLVAWAKLAVARAHSDPPRSMIKLPMAVPA